LQGGHRRLTAVVNVTEGIDADHSDDDTGDDVGFG
jgi:hypothetical protein